MLNSVRQNILFIAFFSMLVVSICSESPMSVGSGGGDFDTDVEGVDRVLVSLKGSLDEPVLTPPNPRMPRASSSPVSDMQSDFEVGNSPMQEPVLVMGRLQ